MQKDQLDKLALCTSFLRNGDSYNAWICFKASGVRLKDVDFDKVMDCFRQKNYDGLIMALQQGISNLFGDRI